MNVTTKQTLTTTKKGKKLIIEEDQYEFCDDLWRYIKEYLFYNPKYYRYVRVARTYGLVCQFNREMVMGGWGKKTEMYIKFRKCLTKEYSGNDYNFLEIPKCYGYPRFKETVKDRMKTYRKGALDIQQKEFEKKKYQRLKRLIDNGEEVPPLLENYCLPEEGEDKYITFLQKYLELESKLNK